MRKIGKSSKPFQAYKIELQNGDSIKELFDTIKEDYGVTIHGILGTNFLDKYNYVIDFKDYIIYRKK